MVMFGRKKTFWDGNTLWDIASGLMLEYVPEQPLVQEEKIVDVKNEEPALYPIMSLRNIEPAIFDIIRKPVRPVSIVTEFLDSGVEIAGDCEGVTYQHGGLFYKIYFNLKVSNSVKCTYWTVRGNEGVVLKFDWDKRRDGNAFICKFYLHKNSGLNVDEIHNILQPGAQLEQKVK